VGTLEHMPFEDGRFDILVMKHVLEHARSPAEALAEARRLLSPGGALVVAVPDVEYWKYRVRKERAKGYRGKLGWEHHVYYSARTLARMLEQHGFQVRATTKAVVLPADSAPGRLFERIRWAGVWLWQALARLTRTRRELFFVATRK
jgi:predicted SAM-dependent methyltransferase